MEYIDKTAYLKLFVLTDQYELRKFVSLPLLFHIFTLKVTVLLLRDGYQYYGNIQNVNIKQQQILKIFLKATLPPPNTKLSF